jgi:hypothetical protein
LIEVESVTLRNFHGFARGDLFLQETAHAYYPQLEMPEVLPLRSCLGLGKMHRRLRFVRQECQRMRPMQRNLFMTDDQRRIAHFILGCPFSP